METNIPIDFIREAQGQLWVDKINNTHSAGRLCPWVSTHHPQKLACRLEGTFHNGSFNAGMKMVFTDGAPWMVRFPRVGKICSAYADEKVAMEVSTLNMIREKTTIPVPRVHSWGSAADNSLGLGPFIMMDFIEGVSLAEILNPSNPGCRTRVMREDISDRELTTIYRQMTNILLQLFKLDFERIGSLPAPGRPSPPRPLTFKAHEILQDGGVDTFGNSMKGFSTTTNYFQYVASQDWEQLLHQPNSTAGFYDAQNRFLAFKTLQRVIPHLIHPAYERRKFKLVCDDLGLANLIVRGKDDLTVVGVVDLEWSYAGPAQLLASAPWWLLIDRPVNSAWDCTVDGEEPRHLAARYFKALWIFTRVLEEEEARIPGNKEQELSCLVKWSQTSGAMWLHMLLSAGFNSQRSFPFTMLRRRLGTMWGGFEREVADSDEMEEFARRKIAELDRYDEIQDRLEEMKALVDSGDMTREEFVERGLALCSVSFAEIGD
ncbi:hypothetical protein BDV18DRAFT_166287 [Aspergillus unguis]